MLPENNWSFDPSRVQFDGSITSADLRTLASQPGLTVLQCCEPVSKGIWTLLNEQFFAVRPDVELRVYGFYSTECDLTFARHMSNVRHFAADCLMHARGVEAVADIPGLESLSLGIYELDDFSVLERVSPKLSVLSLGPTLSKKPGLAPLARFRRLRVLYLEGHRKEIGVVSDLQALEDVTLRSVTTPDLAFLANLPRLWSLDIKLGGIRNFAAIEGKESIEYLELWQVRELDNIDIVGALPGLQNLFLQSLPCVKSFPSLSRSRQLRRIMLENLRGLHDFSALQYAPALEEFGFVDARKQAPTELLPVLRNRSVRRAFAGFGSDCRNAEFAQLCEEHGKEVWKQVARFKYRRGKGG